MTVTPYHLTRVLVAVHRYNDAAIAMEWGSALASALHLPVTLVHVVDESTMRGTLPEAKAYAQDWMGLLATNPVFQRTEVDTAVLTGPTEEALAQLGRETRGALLLFVAFPGEDTVPKALGRDLTALIEAVETPFIVVPAGTRPPDRIRRIVVGIDQSNLAATVLQTARRVAQSLDVDVISVEAVEPDTMSPEEFLQVEPVITNDHVRIRGLASRVLLSTAQARGAAIIAVGSHGAGESRHGPTGSTSTWLSQHADRPVLIVPDA